MHDFAYKIGLTATTMMLLSDMKLAPPDQVVWRPSAVHYPRADFSRVGDGFSSFDWIWDTISIARLSSLLKLLNGAESVRLYAVTDKRDGTYPNPRSAFSVFWATMWKPVLSGEEGVSVVKSPYVMQTVKVQFVNAIELTTYSI